MSNNLLNGPEAYGSSNGQLIKSKTRIIFDWLRRYAAIEIAVLLALAIAAYFLGRHLLDTTIPVEGDVRSHVLKIELLQSYLSHLSWPQWNPYWYQGIPEDQFYPPGFYFLGAAFSFIVRNGVIAYKIMLLLALVLNGLAIYYFSRKILKFDSHLAVWCLIAYETSTPMLINVMYGEGPNLLGWGVTVIFLAVYISRADGNKFRLVDIILPGLLLGIAVLIHPFPVIFAAIFLVVFHAVWLVYHRREWKIFVRYHLPYISGVAVVGAIIGMYYWLPAFLTLNYSSPIYSIVKFMWIGGTVYLLAIISLALTVSIITRFKIRSDPGLDTLIITFAIACALGFGATRYLPFGMGSLVQEFRFAAIIVPFLGIMLVFVPLKYKSFQLSTGKVVLSLAIGLFLTAFVFGLNQRQSFVSGFIALARVDLSSLYQLVSNQFAANFPAFAISMFPYFAVILFLALSFRGKLPVTGQSKSAYILAGGVCLLLLTSFLPYINTAVSANISRLYRYVDNYEQPGYAQLMTSIKSGRLIVPMNKGYLTEGDNPVTFGWRWGVETVNGPYNQGDPKFFKFSVHLEWEERWLNYDWTRENLMHESASKYIFIRGGYSLPSNLNGMSVSAINLYGRLLELNQSVSYADKVAPILIDVKSPREVTEFFNILLPEGYKIILVDVNDVAPDLTGRFEYAMVDDPAKISDYQGKTVFLLNDSVSPSVNISRGIVTLNVPYLTYTNKIFYHGDVADGYMWLGWDGWPGAVITPDMQTTIKKAANLTAPYFDRLDYTAVDYKLNDTHISLGNSAGFTLVKDSYFPYWQSRSADIMPTSQGFMLVHSGEDNVVLDYQKPLYYTSAAVFTILGLIAAAAALLFVRITSRSRR